MITVRCECGKTLSVAAAHRGKRIKCKNCGRELLVPARRQLSARLGAVLTLCSLGYLAAVCVLAIVLWRFGDAWGPATVLLFISRWPFLLPLVVLLPAAIVYRHALIAPLVLAAVICIGPLVGFRTGWHRLIPHAAGTRVRVLTYNVDGGDVAGIRLPDLMASAQPDFVALQECGPALAERLRGLAGWFHHDVRELCFLSRFPIADSSVMDRSALESVNESSAGIGGSGDVVRYAIRMPQGTITITNLHLETPRKGLESVLTRNGTRKLRDNTELRSIEAELARRWVDGGTGPTLVAGDFNTPVESRIFQRSWSGLSDAFSRAGFGLGMTRNNGWIRVRIDHVLSGNGWRADRAFTGPDLGSDHLPLIVDLTLVPAK
jgi:endonuclease/exonuclease/phosphatase (EEP) superfamily protein YafD